MDTESSVSQGDCALWIQKVAENCALQESTNTVEVTVEVWESDLLAEYSS